MGWISEAIAKATRGEFGFRMDEVMSGEHRFEPGFGEPDPRPMEFRITWGPDNLREYLNWRSDRFMTQALSGTVTISGLCEDAPCKGTLELRYFGEHTLR